jgi:ketosteroid isomerase-like protein
MTSVNERHIPETAVSETAVSAAKAFLEGWSKAWRDRDGHAYAALLHEGCVLTNPVNPVTREELPQFVDTLLANMPDHRITVTRWGATADGVLFEWVMTGTLPGGPIEVRGADRYNLRDGKATEGESYFDPRRLLELQQAPSR